MRRRGFLCGLAAGLASAGCLSEDGTGPAAEPTDTTRLDADTMPDDTEDTETDAGTPTEDRTETATGTNGTDTATDTDPKTAVTDQSLTVTGRECGAQRHEATVAFDEAAGTVTVEGTIWANDLAYTAELASVTYGDGTLTTTVATDRDEDAMGAQCIAEIDYEASVTVAGGLPSRVTVRHRHDGETTTAAETER